MVHEGSPLEGLMFRPRKDVLEPDRSASFWRTLDYDGGVANEESLLGQTEADLDHAAGDSCGLEAVTSLSCRIPATSEHAAPPPHVAVSGPAHYFYSSLEIFKDEHLNLYSTHTLPVN